MQTTNSFTAESAQGAAAVSTYQVGATFELNNSSTLGVIISHPSPELYGVLLLRFNDDCSESYAYAIKHGEELNIGRALPLRYKMKLKIASMIIKRPCPNVDYVILNGEEV